mgnify:CR=1 FL=1
MLLAPVLAAAQVPLGRNIPEEAKPAQIRHVFELVLNVGGQDIPMAPGGIIRDRNNLIIVPSALPPGGAPGRYLLDANGQVWRVWLLNESEGAGAAGGGNWNR